MTKFTQLVSANARAKSGPLTVQANALNAGLPFNMPPPPAPPLHTYKKGWETGLKLTLFSLLETQ